MSIRKKISELPQFSGTLVPTTAHDPFDDISFEIIDPVSGESRKIPMTTIWEAIDARFKDRYESCSFDTRRCYPSYNPNIDETSVNSFFYNGMISLFYHYPTSVNFKAMYGVVPNNIQLPNLDSVKMDWMLSPQNATITDTNFDLRIYTYEINSFINETILPDDTVYPYHTTTVDYTEESNGRERTMGRYFGYIKIQTDGLYGFKLTSNPGSTMWLGLDTSTSLYEYQPSDTLRPLITTRSDSGRTTNYMAGNQDKIGIQYNGFYTMYHNPSLTFKHDIDSTVDTNVIADKRIKLTNGMYPFMIDIAASSNPSKTESIKLEWTTGINSTYKVIPSSHIYHKGEQWDAVHSAIKTRAQALIDSGDDSALLNPITYGAVDHTAMKPIGAPLSYVPTHTYE